MHLVSQPVIDFNVLSFMPALFIPQSTFPANTLASLGTQMSDPSVRARDWFNLSHSALSDISQSQQQMFSLLNSFYASDSYRSLQSTWSADKFVQSLSAWFSPLSQPFTLDVGEIRLYNSGISCFCRRAIFVSCICMFMGVCAAVLACGDRRNRLEVQGNGREGGMMRTGEATANALPLSTHVLPF